MTKGEFKTLLILLNPFAPHVTEEAWETMGFGGVVTSQKWPGHDEAKCLDETVEIVTQIVGKVKVKLIVPADIGAFEAIALAKVEDKIAEAIADMSIVKELNVKGKLENLVDQQKLRASLNTREPKHKRIVSHVSQRYHQRHLCGQHNLHPFQQR